MKAIEKFAIAAITTLAGAAIGGQFGKTEEQRRKNAWIGASVGLAGSAALLRLFDTAKDTVNYDCYRNDKLVYTGITYKSRLKQRLIEHGRNGKVFDKVSQSALRTRSQARMIEVKKIKKHLPVLNIQHNY